MTGALLLLDFQGDAPEGLVSVDLIANRLWHRLLACGVPLTSTAYASIVSQNNRLEAYPTLNQQGPCAVPLRGQLAFQMALNRLRTTFARPNTDAVVHGEYKNLAVADLSRLA